MLEHLYKVSIGTLHRPTADGPSASHVSEATLRDASRPTTSDLELDQLGREGVGRRALSGRGAPSGLRLLCYVNCYADQLVRAVGLGHASCVKSKVLQVNWS